MQLPRIFVKDDAQAAEAAGGAAEAAGARPAKPVAARPELEGEKRLPEGASWRWGEPGDEACRMGGTGWYRQVTITEKEGGVERKTNLALPSYVWVRGGNGQVAECRRGGNGCGFFVFVWDERPPPKEILFPFEGVFFLGGEYTGREVWQKLHRGGGASTRLVGMTPPLLWWTPLPIGFGSMHPRGEGRECRQSGDLRWWWLSRMPPPPPLRGKGQTPAPKPSPKPSKVAKVAAAQPPHEALDVEALGASVATHVTDACRVLVEQAAATGVEATLAKGRSADHKSALAKAEKVHGNTQRALDQALNLAAKRGEEVEAMRAALREAQEGRRKAEVGAAQLRVEVEGQRRRGDDLQQRLGVAEAQVRSLTSTLSASFTAQQGLAPQGLQSQGSGSRSGSQ